MLAFHKTIFDDDDGGVVCVCVCVCEQNVTGSEENAEASILWLHCHPIRTQSGATAGVSVIPGEFCIHLGFWLSLVLIFTLLLKSDNLCKEMSAFYSSLFPLVIEA